MLGKARPLSCALPLALLLLAACEGGVGSPADAAPPDGEVAEGGAADGGAGDAAPGDAAPGDGGEARCAPMPGDYTPRVAMSATDDWPACISDLGAYAPIEPTISTVARLEAFDALFAEGGLLTARAPSPSAFTEARALYESDQGLGSRVVRRSDEHVPPPAPADCRLAAVVADSPAYCVGPTQLAPLVREAFAAGMTGGAGEPPAVHAARIDAALTWFFYLSPYKESLTCTETARDCDSAWAYYTGGVAERAGGRGLSRRVRALDPATHDRIWDALLALRCWRDLDPQPIASGRLDLRDRARAQLDRAMDRGVALVIADRLRRMQAASGDAQRAHHAWLRVILAPLPARTIPSPDPGGADLVVPARPSLADRMLRARSAELADRVQDELTSASAPGEIDVDAIVEALERAFPCP